MTWCNLIWGDAISMGTSYFFFLFVHKKYVNFNKPYKNHINVLLFSNKNINELIGQTLPRMLLDLVAPDGLQCILFT